MMKTVRRALTVLLAMALMMTASATAVGAVFSYNGADYSYEYNSDLNIRTCDKESDSTKVKSKTDNNNAGSGEDGAKDVDGNNGICATKYMGYNIQRHQTCEYRAWWPDSCGNWQAA